MFSPFIAFVFSFIISSTPAGDPTIVEHPGWLSDGTIQMMTGADRCSVQDCTCRVTRGNTSRSYREVQDSHRHHVYFLEDDYTLTDNQTTEIRDFAQQFSRSGRLNITLVGYADGCGTPEDNEVLSSNRARVVTQQLRRALPGAQISFRANGEASPDHDPRSRRVDILVQARSNLEVSIARVDADVYLVDASGSLWNGWSGWRNIINASFRPGSRIYVSKMHNCRDGMSLDSVTPAGGTEIWWSYWTVLDKMESGETLAIISDFDSNYPLQAWEHRALEKKVREKGIHVVVIRL